jgi:hypothetical protein
MCSIQSCDRVQYAAAPQRGIVVDALTAVDLKIAIRPGMTVSVDDIENLF